MKRPYVPAPHIKRRYRTTWKKSPPGSLRGAPGGGDVHGPADGAAVRVLVQQPGQVRAQRRELRARVAVHVVDARIRRRGGQDRGVQKSVTLI